MAKKSATRRAERHDLDAHVWQFLGRMRGSPETSTDIPESLLAKLAGLAVVADEEIFRTGVLCAVCTAHKEAPLLAQPVYRGQFVDRLQQIKLAAEHLQHLLNVLVIPKDRISWQVQNALANAIMKTLNRENLSPIQYFCLLTAALAEAADLAQKSADKYGLTHKGRPPGVQGCGPALTRFITHLEYAARAAGGRWKLNKNDQRGTLIDALEILRGSLPGDFLPLKGKHPYSTYQRILTQARLKWRNSPAAAEKFPTIMRPSAKED